jgi:hypothetical protein
MNNSYYMISKYFSFNFGKYHERLSDLLLFAKRHSNRKFMELEE